MAAKDLKIDHSQVSGISAKVSAKLGSGTGRTYQTMIGTLSTSKGEYVGALKKELAKEAAMVAEVHGLLKEIAAMMENASKDFQALDKKWSKSLIQ